MSRSGKWVAFAIFAFAAVSVAMAGGKQEPAMQKPVSIQFAISPREVGKVIPDYISGFEKENPNIKVDWLQVPGVPDEQHTLYVTNMASQADKPDVLAVDVIWPGEFIANGWAAPINDSFSSSELSQYLPGMMNSVTVDGKAYGVPLYTNAIHLFYRKDLLDKYGLSVPKTWEELASTAKEIVQKENNPDLVGYISMWAQIEGLFMNYLQFFWGAGGHFFDNAGKASIDTPAGVKALKTMVGFVKDGLAPQSIITYKPNDAMALFRQGRAVFMVVQDFVWPMLNAADSPVNGKVGMTRVPYFAGHPDASTVCMGGWILIVNPYSTHKAEAARFIKYITSEKAGLEMAVQTGSMPARNGMDANAQLLQQYPIAKQLYADFAVGDVRPSAQAGARYPELSHEMQLEIHSALAGEKTPEQALADAQKNVTKILGK
ncbi:MAG TPA: ABC transporter substrate-binding protein [Spirochaetia bacterium]|nr:ABC transporter substrate-binding protein [Spirochaetia bacterium]